MSTWYVDNEVVSSGTGISPAQAFKTLLEALNAVVGSGDTIYVKATATPYTGSGNLVLTSAFDSKTNLTIDRYPTDTGTSRPVFDRGVSAGGRIWDFGLHTNLTIRNIYFKGKSDSSSDPNSYGMLNVAGGNINGLTIEYCVFEQRYSYIALKMSSAVTNLTVRYCYFFNENATETNAQLILTVVGSLLAGTTTFSYNVCEKYQEALYLNYHTALMNIYIDHNTFIDCGDNRVMMLGTSVSAIFHITNNILYTSIGSCDGINWSGGSGTVSEDYNDFYGFVNNFSGSGGASHVAGIHDIFMNPEWQGGAQTWSETYIALTYYYAPANTNYPIVRGDSISSCMGAIFVTPYVPPNPEPETPTPVTISTPSIPGLGVLPCYGNALFNRLKSHLVDDNIYDTSDAAIGITNYNVTFTGNIGDMAVSSLTIYRNYGNEVKVVSVVIPDASGNYSFNDRLPHGRASYYGKSSDGKYFSNTIHVHSYYIHVWLCAYATELLSLKQQTAQVRQNAKIADGIDFDGNVITTDGYYLAKNFGQYITARKLEDMTRAEYQQLLLNVLEAYNLGPSVEAIDLICEVFTGQLPSLLWYKDVHGFPTTSVRLRVLSPPSLNYQWDATHCYLYDHHYTIPAGSGTIGAGLTQYVYVDGTVSPTTVDDRLSVLATGVMPFRYVMNRSYTVPSTLVRVDTDGTNVGVSGELYVTLSRFPVDFTGASGTLAPFVSGIPGAFLVPHTSNVDLNIAQWDTQKSMLFGNVTVEYTTNYENTILGVVHAGASAITGITSCGRPDGGGAVSRDVSVHENCGELRINGSQALNDDARLDLFNTLRDVKPAHKFFYVYMENETTGLMEYYGKV